MENATFEVPAPAAANSVWFAAIASELNQSAVRAGFQPVSFRSPPRGDVLRSARMREDGTYAIAVRMHSRNRSEVAADMIAGVLFANSINGRNDDNLAAVLHDVADAFTNGRSGAAASYVTQTAVA